MKILHTVKLFSPRSGGMYEVVKQISENLADKGHQITITCLPRPEDDKKYSYPNIKIVEFNIIGNFQNGFSGEVEEYRNYVINNDFEIVTNFAAQQPLTDALLPVLSSIKAKKIFVPTGFNGLYLKSWKKYFLEMPEKMKKYDMNVIISKEQRDMKFAEEHNITNFVIISNGASQKEFSEKVNISIKDLLKIPDNHLLILHVGSHTKFKGHTQAIQLFTQAKTGPATLIVSGNNYPDGCGEKCENLAEKFNKSEEAIRSEKKVIIKHLSRKETLAAFAAADIFLFPSNIEGGAPIVLFESMASKTPFLSTDVGNTKEIAITSQGGIILPTIINVPPENSLKDWIKALIKSSLEKLDIGSFHSNKGFVRADVKKSVKIIEDLCKDSEKRKKLGENGYCAWQENFTWEKISDQYENLYKKLLS